MKKLYLCIVLNYCMFLLKASGAYYYSLYVDGKVIATKEMVLTR